MRQPDDRRPNGGGAGLDEVTRAAVERAEEKALQNARPPRDNVVSLASRRR